MRSARMLLMALVLFAPAALYAQECTTQETIGKCWERFFPPSAVVKAAATDKTQKDVQSANTGVTNLMSPASTALKDFLSLLSASLESSTVEDTGQAFTFDYNPPITILGADRPLKLQAVFADAKLSTQLTGLLGSNVDAITNFDDSLGFDDDVTLSATLSPVSKRWGRSIRPHRDYFQDLLDSLITDDSVEILDEFNQALGALNANDLTPFSTLDDPPAAVDLVEKTARALLARRTKIASYTNAFAQLLNNQSQLYGSLINNSRRNIVGPNEWTAKATYEMGFSNLSSFRAANDAACASEGREKCVTRLTTYAKNANPKDRVVFDVEYHRTNRRWISEPQFSVEYGIARATSFVYSLTYGHTLTAPNQNGGRIDLSLKYQDISGDPDLKDRYLGSLTYTQKVSDKFSFPIGLVYASHSNDLAGADYQLDMHFGLLYKLPDAASLGGLLGRGK